MSDSDRVRRCLDGETRFYDELYARHSEATRACAMSIVQEPHCAMDCVVDGWADAWEKLAQFDPSRSFRAWVCGFVRTRALRARRERSRDRKWLVPADCVDEERGPGTRSLEQEHKRRLMRERLLQAIDRLPEAQRTAVLLQFEEDCSYQEIAERTGRTVMTVGSDIHRGYERLRQELETWNEARTRKGKV